jgi:hypothetical protein
MQNRSLKIKAVKKKMCANNNHNWATFNINSTTITAVSGLAQNIRITTKHFWSGSHHADTQAS